MYKQRDKECRSGEGGSGRNAEMVRERVREIVRERE